MTWTYIYLGPIAMQKNKFQQKKDYVSNNILWYKEKYK